MLLLAGASYRYVENPMRHAEWSAFRWRSIGYGLSALVGAAALLAGLAKPLDGRLYTGRSRKLVAEGVESLTDTYSLRDAPGSWQGEKCVVSDNRQVGKVIPIDECTLGSFSSARRRVLVLVNSYSADRKSTRLNSSHSQISYAVFCLKKKTLPLMPPLSPRQ